MADGPAIDPCIREDALLVVREPHDRDFLGEWPTWPRRPHRITMRVGPLPQEGLGQAGLR